MKVGYNQKLNLFQLYHNPNPKKMFNENYAFLSSTSNSMKVHFQNYANSLKK